MTYFRISSFIKFQNFLKFDDNYKFPNHRFKNEIYLKAK